MGLPFIQIMLYVMAIRPRMDFATGLVGVSSRVSWQAMSEALYIEPKPGIKGGSPHRSALRRAAEGLQSAGLIRIKSLEKQLIFQCVLAMRDKSGHKKADTNPTRKVGTSKPAPVLESSHKADIAQTGKAGIHPVSGITKLYTPPPIDISTGVAVEFHSIIKPETQPAILQYLKHAKPENRQHLIDDLVAYMSLQSGKGLPVKNPAAVIRKMVERDKAGEYVPEQAHIGRAMRHKETAKPEAKQAAEEKPRMKPQFKLTEFLQGKSV